MRLTFGSVSLGDIRPGSVLHINPQADRSAGQLKEYGLVSSAPQAVGDERYEVDLFRLNKENGYLTGQATEDKVPFALSCGRTDAFDPVSDPAYLGQLQMMFRQAAQRQSAIMEKVLNLLNGAAKTSDTQSRSSVSESVV